MPLRQTLQNLSHSHFWALSVTCTPFKLLMCLWLDICLMLSLKRGPKWRGHTSHLGCHKRMDARKPQEHHKVNLPKPSWHPRLLTFQTYFQDAFQLLATCQYRPINIHCPLSTFAHKSKLVHCRTWNESKTTVFVFDERFHADRREWTVIKRRAVYHR